MDNAQKLVILKKDLQLTTTANDEFLNFLLEKAKIHISEEGIILIDGDMKSDMIVIDYAAYLFRKRASADTTMPRSLRYDLNNMLFNQKMGGVL